jgi:flavorubredoxin
MKNVEEIAPDIFRISTYIEPIDLQFNQFLVRDEQPLLFHTGMKKLFPVVREAVAQVMDPSKIRWISFSHYEADECGSLNEWLQLAPNAQTACSLVGALVSVNDFAVRDARGLTDGEVLSTGKRRFRFVSTPHVPHCWEAGLLFEETTGTFFCSDLFHQNGNVEPKTAGDVISRARQTLIDYQKGPFANYLPYSVHTDVILKRLAELNPKRCATMHGSTFEGDGRRALLDLADVMKQVLGRA